MLQALLHSVRVRELFSPEASLQAMLDFEGALARVQARLGLIPAEAAAPIAACCRAQLFRVEELAQGAAQSGNAAIPMVQHLTALVREQSASAARYVHWGATSQDAIDTGLVLQLRQELVMLDTGLGSASALLAALTQTYRDTTMAGRTWLQHAVPITFGLKTAGYLDAVGRHRARLEEASGRVLVLQFGGAAGTLASLGESGLAVAQALAAELELGLPALPWHSHRDRLAEAATLHGLVMGTIGKIARDLALMTQTEAGETAEKESGGSSTMPHKRNPVAAAAMLAAALRVPSLVGTMLLAMVQEHERGLGGWHAEWETLPEICTLTLGALEKLNHMLAGLEVSPAAMQENLALTHGLLFAESVSMRLAKSVGKAEAHRLTEEASRAAIKAGKPLRNLIAARPEIMSHLLPHELDELFDPAKYLGQTQVWIARVLDRNPKQGKE